MKTLLCSLVLAAAILLVAGVCFVYSGLYSVGATEPHWPVTHWLMQTARVRSIAAHAAGITPPAGYDRPEQIAIGVGHFAAHCAVCHGGPGVPRGDIAKGMYPLPPDLAAAAKQYAPGELFWILKHGIKMSGMPSWADHGDNELWATVAFIEQLSGLSEADYARLIQANMMHGMQHHTGDPPMPGMPPPPPGAPHQH